MDRVKGLSERERALLEVAVAAAVRSHMTRWVGWGMLAAFLAACAVSIPVTYVLAAESRNVKVAALRAELAAQKAAAHRNCGLVTKLAVQSREELAERAGETKQFERESKDRLGLSPRRFRALVERTQARERRHIEGVNEIARAGCTR